MGSGDQGVYRLNRLARDRAERPALQRYIRARLRPVFDRLGWDGSGSADDDETLLRTSLIRMLGELGDEDIMAEARRRFAGFLSDPQSLPGALARFRYPCRRHHCRSCDLRHAADAGAQEHRDQRARALLLRRGRARDPALAHATLALT